jgi:hypothetical protein
MLTTTTSELHLERPLSCFGCPLITCVLFVHRPGPAQRLAAISTQRISTPRLLLMRSYGYESFQLVRSFANDAPHGTIVLRQSIRTQDCCFLGI